MGKEVRPTADVVNPGGAPEDTGLLPVVAPEDERLLRNTAVMSVGTALSRLTGFARVAAAAFALGVTESRLADAYNVANTTPNIIYELVLGGILSSVFIPVFVEWLQTRGREEAWDVARTVLTIAVVVLGGITIIGIVGARVVIGLYTSRFSGPQQDAARALGTFFLRWFMPQILIYGVGSVMTGLLNAHRRFAVPMFAPILNNAVVIAAFLIFAALPGPAVPTPDGITTAQRYVLAVGTTAGVLAMTLALWPSLRRIGFRWRPSWRWRHPAVVRIGRLAVWNLVYVAVNQLGLLVVILLAAGQTGGYTAYASAFIFFQLPHGIFAVSIMTALLPALSGQWVDGDRGAFNEGLSRGVRATAFIVLPAALGYIALARPIVRLLLEHGVMTGRSTDLVASVLVFFAIGLFSFSTFQLFLRAFYAMQDTRTPALVNIAAVALNTAVNFWFFHLFGVKGLALGHATAYTFAALVSAVILRRRLGGLGGGRLAASLARIGVAAAATGGAAWLAARWVASVLGTATLWRQLTQVGAGVLAGLTMFIAVSVALRVEEFELVKRFVLSRSRR